MMKLRQISSNCHELRLSKGTILFSYETPVAVSFDLPCQAVGDLYGVYKTNEKFGKTTTKHIDSWTKTERSFDQATIEDLAGRILRAE
jgi:hypothetical protein